ncbi:MAG: hypothetical protein JNM40_14330 [Myxococcales bacterium]|jgi:GTP-binding protein EngB required for normal cell division|nr:hypothetical protein [Myxococcales bacterium]
MAIIQRKPSSCGNAHCTFLHGGRCARAAEFADPWKCTDLVFDQIDEVGAESSANAEPSDSMVTASSAQRIDLGWRGRHLTFQESDLLRRSTPARTIAVLGDTNAGKSSLLTAFFLQLANGQRERFPYRFASSLTLYGWRTLIEHAADWQGDKKESVVGHTPKGDKESADTFLHLGLSPVEEEPCGHRHIDVLLSDVPGEWIREYTERANESNRQPLAFLTYMQVALLVIDADRLEREGQIAAAASSFILQRLLSLYNQGQTPQLRAVFVVLSKCDKLKAELPPQAADLRKAESWPPLFRRILAQLANLQKRGLATDVFVTSAFGQPLSKGQPKSVVQPFGAAMELLDGPTKMPLAPSWQPQAIPADASYFYFLHAGDGKP